MGNKEQLIRDLLEIIAEARIALHEHDFIKVDDLLKSKLPQSETMAKVGMEYNPPGLRRRKRGE